MSIQEQAIAIGGSATAENAASLQKPWRWRDVLNLRRFWLLRRIRRFWKWVSDTGRVLWPCRVGVGVLIAASCLAFATEQGRELTRGLSSGRAPLHLTQEWYLTQEWWIFLVIQGLWIFLSGLWARIVVNAAFSLDRKHECNGTRRLSRRMRWLVKRVPGIIGSLAGVFGAFTFFVFWVRSDDKGYLTAAAVLLLLAIVAWSCSFIRGRACNREKGGLWLTRFTRKQCEKHWFKSPPHVSRTRSATSLKDLPPSARIFVWSSFVLSGLAAVISVTPWAVPVAMEAGTLTVAFSAFASLVAIGSLLIFLSYSWRFPIDMMMMMLAIGLSYMGCTDNHGVRVRDAEQSAMKPIDRPTLEKAFENWRTALGGGTHGQTLPFVIVATAGGGLRAASWTSVVLGAIEEKVPGFHKHVFAISGVSGGSFGAALFNTLLKVESPKVWDTSGCEDKKSFQGRARCVLEQDYLAPAVAGALYPDLLQRIIPIPVLPDRAMAAEQGWEEGWKKKRVRLDADQSPWSRPFLGLWSNCLPDAGCWRPALLLNGTHVETGKRIITSNLIIDEETFTDADDIYKLVGDKKDFRISTAVNNSARFPYVAPAGTLRKNGEATAHIVDGGYFENFGAGTAAELLRAAHSHFRDGFRPIVIQISSDPGLMMQGRLPRCNEQPSNASAPQAGLSTEYGAPLDAFFATREARGIFAVKQLCRLMDEFAPSRGEPAKSFFDFRMCNREDTRAEGGERAQGNKIENGTDPGLGWTMSRESFERISGLIDHCGNKEEFENLVGLLGGTKLVSAQGEQRQRQ